MNTIPSSDGVVLRDQTGIFYLVTPKLLMAAKASPEQQAGLKRLHGDDTAGFGFSLKNFGFFTLVNPVESPKEVVSGPTRGEEAPKEVVQGPTR
jgi:hypothetical protein